MIINNTYFKGDIYIPHAKPSITDDISGVEDTVLSFIDEYSRECLLHCLGVELFNEFSDVLDDTLPDGLSVTADVKWDDLLNGKTYQCPKTGEAKIWRGIRYKSNKDSGYNVSFLAYYVYFFYERYDYITRADTGHQIEESDNATKVSPTMKVVTSWNKFVDMVQGKRVGPNYAVKSGALIVDYYNTNNNLDASLNEFIKDSNLISNDTYSNFKPKGLERINRYGI